MEDTLRTAIRKRAETESLFAISKATGVNHAAIYRFLSGERGLKFESVAKICEYLGLTLVEDDAQETPPKRPGRKKKAT